MDSHTQEDTQLPREQRFSLSFFSFNFQNERIIFKVYIVHLQYAYAVLVDETFKGE